MQYEGPWEYDADADKGIGLARVADHTPLQYGNALWHELLWLV